MPRPLIPLPKTTTSASVASFRVTGEAALALRRIGSETGRSQQDLVEHWILRAAEEYDDAAAKAKGRTP